MSKQVYVFVDESGNHTQTDCYVVAGCWCISEYTATSKILEPTRDRVSNSIDAVPSGEIKGAELTEATLDSVLRYFPKVVDSDDTVWTKSVPWENDRSFAYTVYDSDSDIGVQIAERFFGEGRRNVSPQLVGLASVVSPLLRIRRQTAVSIDSLHVVLDAKTWERPGHVLRNLVRAVDWTPRITFETVDSERTPGIQFSDIAANARRRRLLDGRCIPASNTVDSLRL
jgi:hypothetical protein